MVDASKYLKCKDLSSCVLYTTIEPCPMCSFMAREYKIKSIYIGLNSPHMGGYSKWNILEDEKLSCITPYFGKVPDVHFNILHKENKDFLDTTSFNQCFGIECCDKNTIVKY
jgi:tRNA(adenine34) deaminase